MWLLFALACSPAPVDPIDSADTDPREDTASETDSDDPFDTEDTEDTERPAPCADGMVLVADTFCLDRFEAALEEWDGEAWVAASPFETVDGRMVRAVSVEGRIPQGYISGDEAQTACEASGKRLCTSDEWLLGCQGSDTTTWPYGDVYAPGACNDAYSGHPVIDYFGTSNGVWDTAHMNDPGINQQDGTVAAAGDHPACVSAWGAEDLHGNLHEWVDDADGTFRGGFYADASANGAGCTYRTGAHARGYHDYSTGFRCCAAPR